MDSSVHEYHAAEAILHYAGTPVIRNPPKETPNLCTLSVQCDLFSCPFLYYPLGTNRNCLTFDYDTYKKRENQIFRKY